MPEKVKEIGYKLSEEKMQEMLLRMAEKGVEVEDGPLEERFQKATL